MNHRDGSLAEDLAAVATIDAVPRILEVVCRTTGMGFAAVARVTETRWIACAVRDAIAFGLEPGGELDVSTTICDEIRRNDSLVVIEQASIDPDYCRHATPKRYGFESYISVPIYRRSREIFGTLCAIDPKPARLRSTEAVGMFTLFAELIGFHLDAQERLAESARALSYERQRSELRDKFMAVLGHDLRNPMAAIRTAGRLLRATSPTGSAAHVAAVIESSTGRMTGLVDNLLDLARGELGGGFPVKLETVVDLDRTLEEVVSELQTSWPDRAVSLDFSLEEAVFCDRERVAQMLSNLLANALAHGDPASAVYVRARSDGNGFELSVANQGEPIPAEMLDRLFQPFFRARERGSGEGLGLGLYIASEIARAHRGTIRVTSTPSETRFTCQMPAPPGGAVAGSASM